MPGPTPRYRVGLSGGRGTPLVLLPGIEGDGRVWARVGGLAADREVQAWDLPAGRDLDELARALLAACPRQVMLGGASLGGLVAWRAALLAPERVRAVVALGSLPAPAHRPRGLAAAAAALDRLPRALVRRRYRARIRARLRQEGVPEELALPLLAALPAPEVLASRLRLVAAWTGGPPPAAPILWLRGQVDAEAPWTTAEATRALPGVAVETVPGGHRAMLTHPEPLVRVVAHFLRGVDLG